MSRSDTKAIVQALQEQSAFSDCTDSDLEALAQHAELSSVPANWSLIHQETPSDAVYVILKGSAAVSVQGKQVATVDAGAVVGEAGVAGHKLRNATVTSTSPLELLHIDAKDFEAVVKQHPKVKDALLARTKAAAEATKDA